MVIITDSESAYPGSIPGIPTNNSLCLMFKYNSPMKMNERNAQLKSALGAMAPKERVVESMNVPKEDTINRQGHAAYGLAEELRLVSMLNTLKLQPQYYRSENEIMRELRDLVERIGVKDPYFLAQAIVYSRCMGEGMRSINHLAAALAAPYVSGQEWSRRFYGMFDKKRQCGGTIFRVDDMSEIKDVYSALNKGTLSNAMKKGFASVLENLDTYQIGKYKKTVIDIANLVHPNPSKSHAQIKADDGTLINALDALMKGITISADTWETAQSEAGQEVAKAVKEGKLTKAEAEKVLAEAKADNWEALLAEGKLGIMAALRNIRNIMKNPRKEMIDNWCKLVTDGEKARKALILPIYFDLAYEVVMNEFANVDYSPQVQQALMTGYENSIPNMKESFSGKTCIMLDCSGSMGGYAISDGKTSSYHTGTRATNTCAYKAGLVAATFAKATGADVIKFGGSARRMSYNKNENVFSLARKLGTHDDGWTNPAAAFELITREASKYDRIIFISDNEVNGRLTSSAYKEYVRRVCSPYIYGIDLAAYGTTPLAGDKIAYYCGYGASMYEDIAKNEFNPNYHIEKIRKVVI